MEPFRIDSEIITLLHDMSDDELHSFAELHEDPVNDEQIEIHIYTCFFISTRTRSTEHLEQAIQQMEGWIAVIADDHQDRARRFQILDKMLAERSQLSPTAEHFRSHEMMSAQMNQLREDLNSNLKGI
ncbi:hypothetical protein EG329_010889 [Mollisiaceae sp. DMI_Dod_QoI]|nr:hypothetical protein EG329_010889 [Helotiales sp. DMI_Dod_QoI]